MDKDCPNGPNVTGAGPLRAPDGQGKTVKGRLMQMP